MQIGSDMFAGLHACVTVYAINSALSAWFQTSVLKLNLLVCEALAGFPPQKEGWPVAEPAQEDWHKVIVSFLLKNLNLCAGAELSRLVAPVLRRVFFHFPTTSE